MTVSLNVWVFMAKDPSSTFDRLAPRNQFGATVVSLASLAERVALSELEEATEARSFNDWEGVLTFIRANTSDVRSGNAWRSRAIWFDPKIATNLKSLNRDSQKAFVEAVAALLQKYLRPEGPLSRCASLTYIEPSPGVLFVREARKVFNEYAIKPSLLGRLMDEFEADKLLDRSRDTLVSAIADRLLPGPVPPHPMFPDRHLTDPLMVQAEFLPVRIDNAFDALGSNCDLFAVIREARGWAPTTEAETNMIVRDLLWLRDSAPTKLSQNVEKADSGDRLLGIYFSALDRCSFYVESVAMQGNNVTIMARSVRGAADSQYLTVIFTARLTRMPLAIRDGVLSGCAGDSDTLAAWKCLIIRPNWPFFFHLRTMLHEMTIADVRAKDPYELVDRLSAVGMLHSEGLQANGQGSRHRREAFRRLLLDGTQHPRTVTQGISGNIKRQLVERLQGRFRDGEQDAGLLNAMLNGDWSHAQELVADALTEVVVGNWHLIEPAQFVSYSRSQFDAAKLSVADLARVLSLLELTSIAA